MTSEPIEPIEGGDSGKFMSGSMVASRRIGAVSGDPPLGAGTQRARWEYLWVPVLTPLPSSADHLRMLISLSH